MDKENIFEKVSNCKKPIVLYLQQDWEDSNGAKIEKQFAESWNKKIIFEKK